MTTDLRGGGTVKLGKLAKMDGTLTVLTRLGEFLASLKACTTVYQLILLNFDF